MRRCGSDRIGDVTYALVGIAGPFMGLHIGVILEMLPSLLMYLCAIAGVLLTISSGTVSER